MLGMSLDAGGHLTHGFRPNISGKMFDQRSYGTDPATGLIDYEALRASAREFKPLIIVAGYSAYPRLVNFRIMREIADEVGATLMVDMAHFAGLVAGKVLTGDFDPVPHAQIVTTTTHKSLRGPRGGMVLCDDSLKDQVDRGCPMVLGGPLPHVMAAKAVALAEARQPAFQDYAQRIVDNSRALAEGLMRRGATLVTGGTDNHLNLIDVASSYGLTGRQAEAALLDSGIVTNRNAIPADPNGAWYTSGIRIGTPALTTRGLGTAEMDEVAGLIDRVLTATEPGTTKSGAPSKAQHVLDAEGLRRDLPPGHRPRRRLPAVPGDRPRLTPRRSRSGIQQFLTRLPRRSGLVPGRRAAQQERGAPGAEEQAQGQGGYRPAGPVGQIGRASAPARASAAVSPASTPAPERASAEGGSPCSWLREASPSTPSPRSSPRSSSDCSALCQTPSPEAPVSSAMSTSVWIQTSLVSGEAVYSWSTRQGVTSWIIHVTVTISLICSPPVSPLAHSGASSRFPSSAEPAGARSLPQKVVLLVCGVQRSCPPAGR